MSSLFVQTTDEEHEEIKRLAKEHGLSVKDFVLWKCLDRSLDQRSIPQRLVELEQRVARLEKP